MPRQTIMLFLRGSRMEMRVGNLNRAGAWFMWKVRLRIFLVGELVIDGRWNGGWQAYFHIRIECWAFLFWLSLFFCICDSFRLFVTHLCNSSLPMTQLRLLEYVCIYVFMTTDICVIHVIFLLSVLERIHYYLFN